MPLMIFQITGTANIVGSVLLDGFQDPGQNIIPPFYLAGVPYLFDAGWTTSAPSEVVTTALSINNGGVVNTGFTLPNYSGHSVPYTSGRGLDMGFVPDGKAVYLTPLFVALGLWQVVFPVAGTYTLTLAGVGQAQVTVIGTAPVITTPTITVLHPNPLNRQPSKLLLLTFSGTYPTGGLDLLPQQIGLAGILFADLSDDATYRYTWNGTTNKMQAWTSSGEASGTVSLSTQGLFFGGIG